MQKSKLDKFIQKYNLGGNVNSVKWKSDGDSLSTAFITSDKSLMGNVKVDNVNFESSFKLSILTITNTTTSDMFGMQDIEFANLLTSSKLSLIIFMIIGKIELISVFLIIKKVFLKD